LPKTVHTRSLIILFSDFFENSQYEEIFAALQHCKYNKHEVIIFHVTESLHEEQFGFDNRPLKITDMETGEIIKIQPDTVRSTYIQATLKHSYNQFNTCVFSIKLITAKPISMMDFIKCYSII
jgi:hypothetical protein